MWDYTNAIFIRPNKVTWDEHEIDEVINLRKKENRGFLGHKPKSQ